MATSGHRLLLRVMSGSVTLPEPGSVLMSVAPDTIKATLMPGIWVTPGAMLVPEGHSVSEVMLICMACAATWDQSDV